MNAQKWFDFVKMTVLAVMVFFTSFSLGQNNPVLLNVSQTVNGWRSGFFWGTPDTSEIRNFWDENEHQTFQQQGMTYLREGTINLYKIQMSWSKDFWIQYPKVPDSLRWDMNALLIFANVDSVKIGIAFQDSNYYVSSGHTNRLLYGWNEMNWNLNEWIRNYIENFGRVYLIVLVYTSSITYTGCSFQVRNLRGIFGSDSVVVYDTHTKPVHVRDIEIEPEGFALYQNYPNPFNPSTKIRFSVPEREFVNLTIFDFSGQRVATLVQEEREAGAHEVSFDASGFPSGIYFYRITIGDRTIITKKMNLIK